MTVTVSEAWESRDTLLGDTPDVQLIYIIDGTQDDVEAGANLYATAPPLYGGLPFSQQELKRIGDQTWVGTCHYAYGPVSDNEYTFEIGGGTNKITQSLGTTAYPLAGLTAPNFAGAIGVTKDSVEGVDVQAPTYTWSETWGFSNAQITDAYKATLFQLTNAPVNSLPWRNFAAGEVLFLGASGRQKNLPPFSTQLPWQITFKFAASPNANDIMVGPIGPITKLGWQYLWTRYADFDDVASQALVKQPLAVYVETVYDSSDLNLLGIGP